MPSNRVIIVPFADGRSRLCCAEDQAKLTLHPSGRMPGVIQVSLTAIRSFGDDARAEVSKRSRERSTKIQ